MALLSKLLIPVIAGLSLVTTTVSYAQQVGFKYKVGAVVEYELPSESYNHISEIVEVGSCNEEIKKVDPDSDCHQTHWYKVRLLNNFAGTYTLTDKYQYVNQKFIGSYLGVLHKIPNYE